MAGLLTALELYTCSSCTFTIPTHLARVTCHQCPNHHLCANCHVTKAFNPPHTSSHSAMVFKQSGIVVPLPPVSPRPRPALPPRSSSTVQEDPEQTSKSAWQGKGKGKDPELSAALGSNMAAPLEKSGKESTTGSPDAGDGEFVSGEKGIPASSPTSARSGIESMDGSAATSPSYPRPETWEALFEADSTPTPIFVALMSTIFSHLDPEHTGFLRPEAYSEFLETQGCAESNVWKKALDREEGEHSKEIADLELSLYFADAKISHVLRVRERDAADFSDEEPQSAVEGKIRNSMRFNANMPMISRQGFIDVCALEYLSDPTKGHGHLRKAVKEYGLWKELGDVPRQVLPENAMPKNVETAEVKIQSTRRQEDATTLPRAAKTQGEEGKLESEPSRAQDTPSLLSPITLGSPALPFPLKGGEGKIDALTKGAAILKMPTVQGTRSETDIDDVGSTYETEVEVETDDDDESEKKIQLATGESSPPGSSKMGSPETVVKGPSNGLPFNRNPFLCFGDWTPETLSQMEICIPVLTSKDESTNELTRAIKPEARYWKAPITFKYGNFTSTTIRFNNVPIPFDTGMGQGYGSTFVYLCLPGFAAGIFGDAGKTRRPTVVTERSLQHDRNRWWKVAYNVEDAFGVVNRKTKRFYKKSLEAIFDSTGAGITASVILTCVFKASTDSMEPLKPTTAGTIAVNVERGFINEVGVDVEIPIRTRKDKPKVERIIAVRTDVANDDLMRRLAELGL